MELEQKAKEVSVEQMKNVFTYESYLDHLNELFALGKTTGDNHSEDMLNYAKMNLQRMNRLNKTISLTSELSERAKTVSNKQTWLMITEGWCGDAAQNIPPIAKIASASESIDLKLVLRDENLDLMDQFLTHGGRSIPKLIALDSKSGKVLGTWGPRPEIAQNMVYDFKKIPNGNYPEFQKELQLWYAKDKTMSLQKEFQDLIGKWDLNQQ